MNWYRSLYARIALGVVAFLAVMLVVQAVLFVWVVGQSGNTAQGQSPQRLAQSVAMDLSMTLERDSQTDLVHYVDEQYSKATHPFFVMLLDGRVITSGVGSFPEPTLRAARGMLQRPPPPPGARARRPPPADRDPAGPGRSPAGFGRGDAQFAAFPFDRPVAFFVDGQLAGVVVVPAQVPFSFILSRYAPTLGTVATGVLLVGSVLASVWIFGPPRRRLRALEETARRLGAGDLSARASDKGGDEIAAVAQAFNAMADDLAAEAEELTALDRARRQLLADVSHELTTPVTAMRGYLETLTMDELDLDQTTRARYLGIISDEASKLEHIIGDLLDLARLEGGGGTFEPGSVALSQVFDRVVARHERTCQDAGITMTQRVGVNADSVSGDYERLEQAIQNLAANAIRYSPPGSAIQLTSRRDADAVTITVEDSGTGIPAEHLSHVFDRFYKADASRGDSTGSGLGLSIVKAIVVRHGGRISVASRPGRTVFEIAGLPPSVSSSAPAPDATVSDRTSSTVH